MATEKTFLSIGEIAKRSGLAPSAIRYYEEAGLLHAERAPSGHRRYGREILRRLSFIVFAQRVGLTLDEIRGELARLPSGRVPAGADWSALSDRWVGRIDARISELQRLRHDLGVCIGCGCLSLESCALANPGDEARAFGPGPARWK